MPDEDGYQLIRKIRSLATDSVLSTHDSSLMTHHSVLSTQHSALGTENSSLITHHSLLRAASIPAIALTGYATAKDRERALAAGYQLHLAKPVEPDELVTAILTLLRGRQ